MHNIKFNSQAHWDDLLAAVEKHIYSGDDMSSGDEAQNQFLFLMKA